MTAPSGPASLLMTYGSPESLEREDIRAYLARVRGGREPDAELVDEFTRRYRVIGGSPLIEITRAQAAALARRLGWPVEVGMRFSEPSILTGLSRARRRWRRRRRRDHPVAAVLAAADERLRHGDRRGQSGAGRRGAARSASRVRGTSEPAFIAALADRVTRALDAPAAR